MKNVLNHNKLSLGLDIGIASVGLVLINENEDVLENSLRLFSARGTDLNEERRTARQPRRTRRRKQIRLKNIKELLESYELYKGDVNKCPYEMRVKGLQYKLEKDELRIALTHLAKRRGVSYLEDLEDDNSSNEALNRNLKLSGQGLLPCQIQLDILQKYGKVRGLVEIDNDELYQNTFKIGDIVKEAKAIIQKQQEFHPELNDEFLTRYIEILTRKREYYQGPGSEKSRTDYGIYKTNGETRINLFEDLIGECSVYKTEKRAPAFSYTAQKFNFYNDLNNLSIIDRKLTKDEKNKIFTKVMESKAKTINGKAFQKIVANVCECEIDEISGFTTNSTKDKIVVQTMEGYRAIRQYLAEHSEFDAFKIEQNTFDKISHILTLNTERDVIIQELSKLLPDVNSLIIELMFEFRKKNSKYFSKSKWHSFSLKLMHEIQSTLEETPLNQMQILYNTGLINNSKESFKGMKYIPTQNIIDKIYNPTVERSVNEALKMVNAIIKKYGKLDYITVEMPRDKNEDERKLRIKKEQKINEERNEEKEEVIEKYNLSNIEYGKMIEKLKLLEQQDYLCLYSGKKISESELINNPSAYEVDHIIPQSISFDDSMQNKVIVCHKRNQHKGNLTPFGYLNSKDNESWNYSKFKIHVKYLYKINKISKKKMEYLLEERNLNKYENCYGFINRNLVDTRYASKVVLNSLRNFFEDNDEKTIVKTIRGKQVSQLRKKWRLEKDRGEDFHHCVDAAIIAAFPYLKLWDKKTMRVDASTGELFLDGEFVDDEAYEYLANPKISEFIGKLKGEIPNSYKVSYKVDRKANRRLTNGTIYSVRTNVSQSNDGFLINSKSDKEFTVGTIKNIYSKEGANKFLEIYKKDKTAFLMYHHDKATFDIIEKIIKDNSNSKNPFVEYGEIRKYSKKNNGPIIKNVKYYGQAASAYQDMSHKYITPQNKKVVQKGSNSWRSDVYYDHKKKKYTMVTVCYNDCRFLKGGKYGITYETYASLLNRDGLKINVEDVENLIKDNIQPNNYSFCFSLYKNEVVSWKFKEEMIKCRYKAKSSSESYFEGGYISNITYKKYVDRYRPTLKKGVYDVKKYHIDALGNEYPIKQEKLSLTL